MNTYEMTFIVRPDLDEDGSRNVVETVTGRLEAGGGEILATVPWNPPRRRMAYQIRDFGDGFYVTTVFKFDPQGLRAVENQFRLNENILRFLILQATEQNVKQAQQRMQQAAARPQAAPAQEPQPDREPGTEVEAVAVAPSEDQQPEFSPVQEGESVPTEEAMPVPEVAAVPEEVGAAVSDSTVTPSGESEQ